MKRARAIDEFDIRMLVNAADAALESASWGCQRAGPDFPYFIDGNVPCHYNVLARDWTRCRAHSEIYEILNAWEDEIGKWNKEPVTP